MRITDDHIAGYQLLEQISGIEFEVVKTEFTSVGGSGQYGIVTLQLEEDNVEWCSFGLMFAIAVLSFAGARPRGVSESYYNEKDEYNVSDFVQGLRYENGELRLHLDYIRGRCLKTDIIVNKTGLVTIETRNRGEALSRWIDQLKGKKLLKIVPK
jgi:hypothetical protein